MDEDFQIIFVAKSGRNHLSDIAVDDVRLIFGDECKALDKAQEDSMEEAEATTCEELIRILCQFIIITQANLYFFQTNHCSTSSHVLAAASVRVALEYYEKQIVSRVYAVVQPIVKTRTVVVQISNQFV